MDTQWHAGPVPDVKQLCRLLEDLGHSLENPLASILLTSEVLANNSQGNLTQNQVRSLKNVVKASNELNLLMKRVVLLTRLATRQLQVDNSPFPLEQLVEDLAAIRPTVKISLASPLPASFTSDRPRLFQLLELMLEFALRLGPAPELELTSSPAEELIFVVKANGLLSEEQKTGALDPFGAGLKLARESGGPGLELAIIDHLIIALGGRLQIDHPADGEIHFEASFPPPPPE